MAAVVAPLEEQLRLVSQGRKRGALDLAQAVSGDATMTRTIDGASTIEVPLADHERVLLRSPVIDERCWVEVGDLIFELVQLSKAGDIVTLTFEDSIAAALRRRKGKLSIPAGSRTRAQIVSKLAREARVDITVDPAKRGKVSEVVERSADKEKTNSWDLTGELAEAVKWRRFSDGRRLVVGSDDWLMGRFKPTPLQEYTDAVTSSIDFDQDVGKRAQEATFTVGAEMLGMPPGALVSFGADMGPAEGDWLVAEVTRPLTSDQADVRVVRKQKVLKEPKRKTPVGDPGDPDKLPGQGGTAPGGTAANGAREAMVRFALAQAGDSYVWGGNGPSAWDCSGLVQAATAAAGRTLGKPSASQWGACVAQRKTISVAAALGIRGALLFRIGGEYNHVAISLGNGTTIEAKGTAYGTGVFGGAAGGGWTGAALWL